MQSRGRLRYQLEFDLHLIFFLMTVFKCIKHCQTKSNLTIYEYKPSIRTVKMSFGVVDV